MPDEKFVDPRLQAKESYFQQLHLSTFDTMSYAHAIVRQVNESGKDIDENDENYEQLLRDYAVTKNMVSLKDSPLEQLCTQTDNAMQAGHFAHATKAQLAAAATNTINHWRILAEIPDDLLSIGEITDALKQNYNGHLSAWQRILQEIN
jgi:hypothetical protein